MATLAACATLAASCSSGDGADGRSARARTGAGAGASAAGGLEVRALSTRPEYVTGGDVVVEVDGVPDGARPSVRVDGRPLTSSLAPTEGGRWRGLVSGLPDGASTVTVRAGGRSGSLDVDDHPVTGPLFSGPHQEPYVCTTDLLDLGPPTDGDCSLATTVRWDYFATDGTLRPLADRSTLPADVATARIGSADVPLVVRSEVGTADRGVYWVSGLDPTPAQDRWAPAGAHWNGDLVYRFGGGCGTTYSQGSPGVGGARDLPTVDRGLLEAGYLVATNTLNTFQVHCNDVLAAEAALVTKEQVAERWAVPEHTIGEGASGGAIQQFLITQDYPGILDAVAAVAPFPDAMSIAPGVADCGLLLNFYASPEGADLTPDQQRAVNGHASPGTCGMWAGTFLQTVDPTVGCELPRDDVYDPATNPGGVRCTLQDSNVNTFGRDPRTGFAERPLDNTGVQYGLGALRSGAISLEQFLRLNEHVGGYDIDGRIQPERMRADEADLRRLSEGGRVVVGAGDSLRVPMIVVNGYSDPTGDIHDRWRIFALRERLARRLAGDASPTGDGGPRPLDDTPNLAIWTTGGGSVVESLTGGRADVRDRQVRLLSDWLDALDAAPRPAAGAPDRDWAAALAATRPADATDTCTLPDGRVLSGADVYVQANDCTAAYPLAGDPRLVAGEDLAGITGKCRLTPLDPASYGVALTPAQEARLRAVFPDGVCDWSRPGVGQVAEPRAWATY